MPRRHPPRLNSEPQHAAMARLELDLHTLWNRWRAQLREEQERSQTRDRYDRLHKQLTGHSR